MKVQMGKRDIGDDESVYVVFEAGPTHTGLESAKQLIEFSQKAGADAIKFQFADHRRLIADEDLMFSYQVLVDRETGAQETVTEPLIDVWSRRYLEKDQWKALKQYADEVGIDFFATVFYEDDVDFLVDLGVTSIKIASTEVGHVDLITYCARKGIPVQVDTGNASIGEVERAVDTILETGNEQIIVNHCPSGYPARVESIHLNMIRTLRDMFSFPVAFSDHTPGWEMDVAAVALGVHVVEKTITLDRTTRGCEHLMSLEPGEMEQFVQTIRAVEKALGERRRTLPVGEKEARRKWRRSPYLTRDVGEGERFSRDMFDFRRPGLGLQVDNYHHWLNQKLRSSFPAGHMVTAEDFE